MKALAALLSLIVCGAAHAGAQIYEPMAANVLAAMSASISDRSPALLGFHDPEDARLWLNEMSSRLARRLPAPLVKTHEDYQAEEMKAPNPEILEHQRRRQVTSSVVRLERIAASLGLFLFAAVRFAPPHPLRSR